MDARETPAEVMAAVDAFYAATFAYGRASCRQDYSGLSEVNRCRDRVLQAATVYRDAAYRSIERQLIFYKECIAAREQQDK